MTSAAPDNRSIDKNAGVMRSIVPVSEDFFPLMSASTSVISGIYSVHIYASPCASNLIHKPQKPFRVPFRILKYVGALTRLFFFVSALKISEFPKQR